MKNLKKFESFVKTKKFQKDFENKPIILVGPQGTGKSTTSRALAKRLSLPLITTDMSMVDKKYEELCKNEPGVEVKIKRHPTQGIYYESNGEYVLCVLNKLMEEYNDKKIVLDVGGTHAYINEDLANEVIELFNDSPNVFIFTVSDDEVETYQFLKGRRKSRGENIENENEKNFIDVISNLMKYYKNAKKIKIINTDGSDKSTEELVQDIIKNLD
jgi:shikimate kinase